MDEATPRGSATLSPEELRRYDRHVLLPEVGVDGQARLKSSGVLVVGAGGLGSPLLLYLAAAGVGRIGLVEFDRVDESNLQRQIVHGTSDIGRSKLDSARDRLHEINPFVSIEPFETALTSRNAMDICRGYDVIVDGTDNFPTRYLVNDVSVLLGKPNVHGSIFRFEGQVSVFWAAQGPCYRCLFPQPPPPGLVPSCAEGGVLGVLPGVIGALQATETIKLLLGKGEPLIGRLLLYDALALRFRELRVRKDEHCPVCGPAPTILAPVDYGQFCGVPGPTGEGDPGVVQLEPAEAHARIAGGALLLDVRNPDEWERARIGGATLVPLAELSERIDELPRDREIVVYCRSGPRSTLACQILAASGRSRVANLRGGILAWADSIDPSLPRS